MSPEPDPSATTATTSDSNNAAPTPARTAGVERRAGRGAMAGRVVVGIMGAIVGGLCGFTAAVLATTSVIAGDAPKPVAVAAVSGPSIAGRWSGTPYAIKNDARRCKPDGECTLVLDIVPCANGWCGIEVDAANVCGGEAMQLTTHADKQRQNAFQGKLSLGKGTDPYVIDASFDAAEDGRPATLELVGDTGPEFRWFRRSFPFHAALTRVGDAACKANEKPVS